MRFFDPSIGSGPGSHAREARSGARRSDTMGSKKLIVAEAHKVVPHSLRS